MAELGSFLDLPVRESEGRWESHGLLGSWFTTEMKGLAACEVELGQQARGVRMVLILQEHTDLCEPSFLLGRDEKSREQHFGLSLYLNMASLANSSASSSSSFVVQDTEVLIRVTQPL